MPSAAITFSLYFLAAEAFLGGDFLLESERFPNPRRFALLFLDLAVPAFSLRFVDAITIASLRGTPNIFCTFLTFAIQLEEAADDFCAFDILALLATLLALRLAFLDLLVDAEATDAVLNWLKGLGAPGAGAGIKFKYSLKGLKLGVLGLPFAPFFLVPAFFIDLYVFTLRPRELAAALFLL